MNSEHRFNLCNIQSSYFPNDDRQENLAKLDFVTPLKQDVGDGIQGDKV